MTTPSQIIEGPERPRVPPAGGGNRTVLQAHAFFPRTFAPEKVLGMTKHRGSWWSRLLPRERERELAAARRRMAALRAARKTVSRPYSDRYVPGPRPVPDPLPLSPPAVLPVQDHALTWARPPTEADCDVLTRMLARAESDGRVLAAASIRARITELGGAT
jgi:hypothetical protein